ncbi:DUF3310 domain-containing protein [bacterium]|nr:DUF3310 domain-containing protein [bacterium]NDG18624.1 DUF3310 domain-containing protein [Betaproteobacteria bacterium]
MDTVNHPKHYTSHPSGVECIEITEHMNFCLGNAVKYIWRANLKGKEIEDLRKARWYIDREIQRILNGETNKNEAELKPAKIFHKNHAADEWKLHVKDLG